MNSDSGGRPHGDRFGAAGGVVSTVRYFVGVLGYLAVAAALIPACAVGPRLVLKGPIVDQCTDVGLRGCSAITEGALLFAEGNQAEGEKALAIGLRENVENPQELRSFADGLEVLGKVPGAAQYVAPLQPVIRAVQAAALAAEKHAMAQKQVASESSTVETANGQQSQGPTATNTGVAEHGNQNAATVIIGAENNGESATPGLPERRTMHTEFVIVAGHQKARFCQFPGAGKMSCVHELVSTERWVDSILVSSACPFDVLVAGGMGVNSDWLVFSGRGQGTSVSGVSLPVTRGHFLTFGIDQSSAESLPGVRCGITLSYAEAPGGLSASPR